jgi:uncharacterized protein (TIGR02300 family)
MPKAKKATTSKATPSKSKAQTQQEVTRPASLGTKRQCHKCATKFYDFEKPEVFCPKCNAKIDLDAINPFKEKRARSVAKEVEEEVVAETEESTGAASGIESLEELDDAAEEEIVETIVVEDEENGDF